MHRNRPGRTKISEVCNLFVRARCTYLAVIAIVRCSVSSFAVLSLPQPLPTDEAFGKAVPIQIVLDIWKPFGYGNRMVTNSRRQTDAVFRALSDPTRREILGILRHGHQTVGRIAGNFRMSRPAISKHLRLLHAAGLVVTEKRGAASVCSLDAKPLRAIDDWLHNYEMFWSESLKGLKKYVEEKQ